MLCYSARTGGAFFAWGALGLALMCGAFLGISLLMTSHGWKWTAEAGKLDSASGFVVALVWLMVAAVWLMVAAVWLLPVLLAVCVIVLLCRGWEVEWEFCRDRGTVRRSHRGIRGKLSKEWPLDELVSIEIITESGGDGPPNFTSYLRVGFLDDSALDLDPPVGGWDHEERDEPPAEMVEIAETINAYLCGAPKIRMDARSR